MVMGAQVETPAPTMVRPLFDTTSLAPELFESSVTVGGDTLGKKDRGGRRSSGGHCQRMRNTAPLASWPEISTEEPLAPDNSIARSSRPR